MPPQSKFQNSADASFSVFTLHMWFADVRQQVQPSSLVAWAQT